MWLQRRQELWGRRTVALGVLFIAAALIGGLVLLVTGGDDDSDSEGSQVSDLQERLLKRTVVIPRDGISVRRPADWRERKDQDLITLLSPNRCVSVSLSAPADAKEARGLHRDSLSALRQLYEKVQVGPGGRGNVGGIPTMSDAVRLTDDKGNRRRVLLSIGRGKQHAYVTQVVLGNPACQSELAVAQVILSSIEYTK
jgi:hypothetical protein